MRPAAAILAVAALLSPCDLQADASRNVEVLSFDALDGWLQDDHDAALATFLKTCGDMKEPDWSALCGIAREALDARWFFETFFRPVLIEDSDTSLVTGYFEPELRGSRTRTVKYRIPVYAKPPELVEGNLWHDRETIEVGNVVSGRGLELAWVDDPTALFYMQVQGSGRIRLTDGNVLRLGYAASNGHTYRSPGEMLADRGVFSRHQVSAPVVAQWVRDNPVAGAELLRNSPSYVFFRKINGGSEADGPRGAMNRPLTQGRSLAIDPSIVKLGAPVWLEKGGDQTIRRLMIAQDTGSAIKGAQRADFFVGTGEQAGRTAQRMRDAGRMFVLLPIERAFTLALESN